ncbi:DUF3618 domain-containing protein [Streptomyces sp. NPDC050095]|uniref:DUF3618 domain-containing protein n=1 Tax=unclassified Streptomyces TaxID=2593676 RepID=UPI0034279388
MTRTPHHEQTAASGPEELREEIERTRADLGHTVEALAAKADVKARAKEKTARLKERATDRTDALRAHATAGADRARARATGLAHRAQAQTPEPIRQMTLQGARTAGKHPAVTFTALSAGALVVWLSLRRHNADSTGR